MSLQLRETIVDSLNAVDLVVQREHAKVFTVEKPAWELLYAGRELDGNRWRNVWTLVVWGGPDIVPNSQKILQMAVERVSEALLPIECLLLGDFSASAEVPGLSQLKFTNAQCTLKEA